MTYRELVSELIKLENKTKDDTPVKISIQGAKSDINFVDLEEPLGMSKQIVLVVDSGNSRLESSH